MSVLNPKTRLICFRMSQHEYERLQALRNARGARSLSGFVRGSMSWIIENCDPDLRYNPSAYSDAATSPQLLSGGLGKDSDATFGALTGLVLMLCRKTDSLDQEIKELMTRLKPAGRLGCAEAQAGHEDCEPKEKPET